jgi:hypothetical protein
MTKMNAIEIKRYVDRLFKANRRESWAEIPILGGHYVPRKDNIRPLKKKACAALDARRWFYENGPADLQPLPLSYGEREDLKRGGALHILAWFARSLEAEYYDYLGHPSFFDYACGVMASEHAPNFIKKEQLLKRFPPRPLDGLGPALCWEPPEEHARTMADYRRSEARAASYRASRNDPSKPVTCSQ